MNELTSPHKSGGPDKRRRTARMTYGAIIGGVMGFTLTALALQWVRDEAAAAALSLTQGIALIIAAATGVVGAIMAAMSFSRRLYEIENQSEESDPEEYGEAAPLLRYSGLSLGATSVQYAALAVPPHWGLGAVVIPLIIAALSVQIGANRQIWLLSDELRRTVTLEAGSQSLAIILTLTMLWAVLASYGYVGIDPLALVIVVGLANLLPMLWITHRRGI
jgi:hypothetical protein